MTYLDDVIKFMKLILGIVGMRIEGKPVWEVIMETIS